jgi:uncharacterized protein (DUF2252 family)
MKITKATKQYEKWLGAHTALVEADLALKHQRMAQDLFGFLRATFYRWMQLWPEKCANLARAPSVLGVGDLHVENFGTWRDGEGRLIWGINDFDEAFRLPYTLDLVRLSASAHLAIAAEHLGVQPEDACDAILEGYVRGLKNGGGPFVLAEEHTWLRELALGKLRDPVQFWVEKMEKLATFKHPIPASAREALEHLMPERDLSYRVVHRVAGLGSLGRQRYVALADWNGGRVAREAKALVPSACVWAAARKGPSEILYHTIITSAVRCPDPFVQLRGHWVVRRLAPDCCRIELTDLPKEKDETHLLQAMGRETANIHLGSRNTREILRHLGKLPSRWLHTAAKALVKATTADWEDWKKASR